MHIILLNLDLFDQLLITREIMGKIEGINGKAERKTKVPLCYNTGKEGMR